MTEPQTETNTTRSTIVASEPEADYGVKVKDSATQCLWCDGTGWHHYNSYERRPCGACSGTGAMSAGSVAAILDRGTGFLLTLGATWCEECQQLTFAEVHRATRHP